MPSYVIYSPTGTPTANGWCSAEASLTDKMRIYHDGWKLIASDGRVVEVIDGTATETSGAA